MAGTALAACVLSWGAPSGAATPDPPTPAAAPGGQALALELGPGLPFVEGELRRMVGLRLTTAPAAACRPVRVEAPDPGLVVVSCADRRGEIWVGDRVDQDAARVVAVLLADLVTVAAAPPLRSPPTRESTPAIRSEAAAGAGAGQSRLSLWLAPGINLAASSEGATFEPNAGAGWNFGDRGRWLIDVGFARMTATTPKSGVAVSMETVPLRAGAAVGFGSLELQAGAVGRGFRAHAGSTKWGVRPGGWAAVVWAFRSKAALQPFVTAGMDAYFEKMEIEVDQLVTLTMGRLQPWVALGLSWRRGRG